MTEKTERKINRKEYLERVAVRSGCSIDVVSHVYGAMISEIENIMKEHDRLLLTGFGSFYVHRHKGHPVQFGQKVNLVCDYPVAKFSASNVLNKKLREETSMLPEK